MNAYEEQEYTKQLDLSLWKRILQFARPHWKLVLGLCISISLTAIIDLSLPLFSKIAIDTFITAHRTKDLWLFITINGLLAVLQGFNVGFFILFADKLAIQICYDVRKMGFKKLQELSFSFYDLTPVGNIMARMNSDVNRLSDVIGWGLVDTLWSVLVGIGTLITMFILDWRLALIVAAIMPVVMMVSVYFQKRILKNYRAVRRVNSQITGSFNEGIMGARTTKTLVREDANFDEFRALTSEMRTLSIRSAVLSAIYMPIIMILGSVTTAAILWWGGVNIQSMTITFGTLTAFIGYASQFFEPMRNLARIFSEMQSAQAAGERIVGLLDTPVSVTDTQEVMQCYGDVFAPHRENWEPIEGEVRFEDVTFSYVEGEEVLHRFNLDVKAGDTIAIVGETGSGKSTIVNLVCRFYEPTSGRILIDGKDYKDRSQLWLQSNLGYVLQTPHLFSGTIRENIRYAKMDATDEEVQSAADLVHASGFIQKLEKGFDTEVGEGGNRLSTGEKQLVSFARAILANPRIFVLDEATSSIDTETEQLIQNAIQNVLQGRTSFIIAHRLSTIRSADRILVIDDGHIIEDGTHTQLIRARGNYYQLYTNQFMEESTQSVLDSANNTI